MGRSIVGIRTRVVGAVREYSPYLRYIGDYATEAQPKNRNERMNEVG
jgi:hypothetical protein